MAQTNPAYPIVTNELLTANYAVMGDSFRISEESLSTLEITYTTGTGEAGTSLKFIVEFSANETDWVQESSATITSGVNTLVAQENKVAGGAGATTYTAQYYIPICSRFVRIKAKETGVGVNFGRVKIIACVSPFSGQSRNLQEFSIAGGNLVVSTKTALTASSPTFATIGVASSQAVAANANRKGLVLINISDADIFVGIGAAAVVNRGIVLLAGGGTWVMDEFTFNTAAINAISTGANKLLTVQEFT